MALGAAVSITFLHLLQYDALRSQGQYRQGQYSRWQPAVKMKTSRQLFLEFLFADDCILIAHTEKALQRIVKCFAKAAKVSGPHLEVMYQHPPGEPYSPLHIIIDSTDVKGNGALHIAGQCQRPRQPPNQSQKTDASARAIPPTLPIRSILNIKWQECISSEEVLEKAHPWSIVSHVTRMESLRLALVVFSGQLCERKRGASMKALQIPA